MYFYLPSIVFLKDLTQKASFSARFLTLILLKVEKAVSVAEKYADIIMQKTIIAICKAGSMIKFLYDLSYIILLIFSFFKTAKKGVTVILTVKPEKYSIHMR